MSEQIDWSKAPKWAKKHGLSGAFKSPVWLDDEKYTYVDGQQDGKEFFYADACTYAAKDFYQVSERPATPSWSGEGLPPVGVVCDVFNRELSNPEWEKCTILFAGKHRFLYDSGSCAERCGYIENLEFRPIRTPEQIESDARIKAAQEWLKSIELEYGEDVADQCENILMAAEEKRMDKL